MPVSVDEVMELLCSLAKEEKMRVSKKHLLKSAGVGAAGAGIGTLVGGPIGMALGGLAGGLVGAYTTKHGKPVPEMLMELSGEQKQKLFDKVKDLIWNLDTMDSRKLKEAVKATPRLHRLLVEMLVCFFKEELSITVKY